MRTTPLLPCNLVSLLGGSVVAARPVRRADPTILG